MQADDFKCVVTVAQTKNITQAAEKLYMTQPALSRKISAIERNLGVKLFERTTRFVSLTPMGKIYYEHALKIVSEYQELCDALFSIKHSLEGTIRIGYSIMMGNPDYLVKTVSLMSKNYPNIKIDLIAETSPRLIEELDLGKLDCIIIASNYLNEKNYVRKKIHAIQMFCVLPNEHPLAERKIIPISKLKEEPFLMMRKELAPNLYSSTIGICQKEGFTPKVVKYTNKIEELLLLVRAGRGVALLSSDIQGDSRTDVSIHPVDVERPNPTDRVFAWKKDNKNELVLLLWENLHQIYTEM